MVEKIISILKQYSIKRILLVYILCFIGLSVIAQDSVVVGQKSWMNKLTTEDQQNMELADQYQELANDLLNETDSLEKELIMLKSLEDSINQTKINFLTQKIVQKKYEVYSNIAQANNIKIQIYTTSIDKEISKVDASIEYFEKIGNLIKVANVNLDKAAILKKDLISENDTNIYIEKLISINKLDNNAIQNFKEISTIIMIIEENSTRMEDNTNVSFEEPEIDESKAEPDSVLEILSSKTELISYEEIEDSVMNIVTKPDSIIPIEKDTLMAIIDSATSTIDNKLETVQDSDKNMAYEKNIAILYHLLDQKYSSLEMSIGGEDTAKYLNVILYEEIVENIKLSIEDYTDDSIFEKNVAILQKLFDQKYGSLVMAIGSEDSSKYVNVIIDEEIVETIKLAIENYEEDTVADLFNITSFDIELILNAFENYVEEISPILESDSDISDDIEDDDDLTLAITETNRDKTEITNDDILKDNDDEKIVVKEPKEKIESISNIGQLIFRVQIGAGNNPLSENKLKLRYKGNREIKMFQEEGWYKYYIADCNTLKEAILIKKESKVSDAFIMAYKDGVKIQFYLKYVKPDKIVKSIETKDNHRDLVNLSKDKTTIVVQIVASRLPMKDEGIRKIYSGNERINYIEEEGWHKYSIGDFSKFKEANSLRKTLEVPGAFVVAYKNGEKIDLWAKYKKKEK